MKSKLENLIASGETKVVISILLAVTERLEISDLRNQVIMISTQYQELLKGKNLGIYDVNDSRKISSQINQWLLWIISQLEDSDFVEIAVISEAPLVKSRKSIWVYLMAALVLLVGFVVFLFFPKADEGIIASPTSESNQDSIVKVETTPNHSAIKKEKVSPSIPVVADDSATQPMIKESPKVVPMTSLKGQFVQVVGDSIKSFKIAAHETTVEQYLLFCKLTGHGFPKNVDSTNKSVPITFVTWNDAKSYCEYVGGRLPTVKEWEFAARGGKQSKGFKYSGGDSPSKIAWSGSDKIQAPKPVGTKLPNELGIFDMSGNVSEWCSDEVGIPEYRPVKGGGYKSYSNSLVPTEKTKPLAENSKNGMTGFRVVF